MLLGSGFELRSLAVVWGKGGGAAVIGFLWAVVMGSDRIGRW